MSRRMQLQLNAEVGQRGNAAAPRAMRGGLFSASSSSINGDYSAGRDDGDDKDKFDEFDESSESNIIFAFEQRWLLLFSRVNGIADD